MALVLLRVSLAAGPQLENHCQTTSSSDTTIGCCKYSSPAIGRGERSSAAFVRCRDSRIVCARTLRDAWFQQNGQIVITRKYIT